MFKYVLAGLLILVSGLPAIAQCNLRSRVVYPTYAAKVYTQYNQYHYQAPHNNYKDIVLVPKAIEVVVSPDYYFSVSDYYRDKLLVDALAGRILDLQRQQNQPPLVQPQPVAPPKVTQMPPVTPMTPVPVNPPVAKWENVPGTFQKPELLQVLNTSCAKCHSPSNSKGGLSLVTSDGKIAKLSKEMVLESFRQVNTGRMPKSNGQDKADPVSDQAVVLFDEWVENVR
jgi:hypothetical protein